MAIQGLPFIRVQDRRTCFRRDRMCQHGREDNPPRNHTEQCQAALQAFRRFQLAHFHGTATLQRLMPNFNAPAATLPRHDGAGLGVGQHRNAGQQQPFNGRDAWGGDSSTTQTTHNVMGARASLARRVGGWRQIACR